MIPGLRTYTLCIKEKSDVNSTSYILAKVVQPGMQDFRNKYLKK